MSASPYTRGIVLVLLGSVFLSTSGLIVRHVEDAGGWQIQFWRMSAMAVTMLVAIALRYRGRLVTPFRSIGRTGITVGFCLAFGSIGYLFALLHTTVANAMFIISATPLVTALGAWLLLGERVARRTWIAIAAAVAGITLMVVDGLTGGRMLGNLFALTVTLTFAIQIVLVRRSRLVDMWPAICLAGVISASFSALMADGLAVSTHDFIVCMLLGSVQFACGFMLLTAGTRYVPAAEVSLLALGETLLAPVWVWLFLGETPSGYTLVGGAVVIGALLAQAIPALREARRTQRG